MLKRAALILAMLLVVSTQAAELKLDWSEYTEKDQPKGFKNLVAGGGAPGDWRIILDDVPSAIKSFSASAPVITKRPVLAQLSRDTTDEHFPLFVFNDETFDDFTFTTRFKIVDGKEEQMAGIVFRLQDEKNFYVIRANAKDGNIRFYKMVNGQRGPLIGPPVEVKKATWYELTILAKGNQIRCQLNGKDAIPPLEDNSFASGKVGFWTKSDSVAYFTDTKITYTPREPYAQMLIKDTVRRFPRLVGLRIAAAPAGKTPTTIGSTDAREVGQAANKTDVDIMKRGVVYTAKGIQTYSVYLPLHDRNGDIVGCTEVVLETFFGQTEKNAIARAIPIIKYMELKVQSLQDLVQ